MLRAGVTTVGVGSAADTLTVPTRLQASAAAALGAEFDQKVQLLNDRFSAQMSATAAGGGGAQVLPSRAAWCAWRGAPLHTV